MYIDVFNRTIEDIMSTLSEGTKEIPELTKSDYEFLSLFTRLTRDKTVQLANQHDDWQIAVNLVRPVLGTSHKATVYMGRVDWTDEKTSSILKMDDVTLVSTPKRPEGRLPEDVEAEFNKMKTDHLTSREYLIAQDCYVEGWLAGGDAERKKTLKQVGWYDNAVLDTRGFYLGKDRPTHGDYMPCYVMPNEVVLPDVLHLPDDAPEVKRTTHAPEATTPPKVEVKQDLRWIQSDEPWIRWDGITPMPVGVLNDDIVEVSSGEKIWQDRAGNVNWIKLHNNSVRQYRVVKPAPRAEFVKTAKEKLEEFKRIVSDDSLAASFQSIAHYRSALLLALSK